MNSNPVIPHYFGSKNVNGVYQFIINHIPPHKNYIEGFLGSGKILLTKKPATGMNIGIDKAASIIDRFNYVSGGSPELTQTETTITAHSGPNSQKQLLGPPGTYKFICGSFIDEFEKLPADVTCSKDTFIYADPPYPTETRLTDKKYQHEMSRAQHKDFLNYVISLPCKIIISSYENRLYSTMLEHWNKEKVKSMTRGGVRWETVYFNYDACKLHDTQFVGNNFTDRQRIKRKIARNIAKIQKLPPQEQQAFLEAIKAKFF